MRKLRMAILRNEVADDHLHWVKACELMQDNVDYAVVDLTRADWLENVLKGSYDGLLAIGTGWTTPFKVLYDERVTILNQECGIPVYPTLKEIYIYENKKYFSYWLQANRIPHPETHVFYYQDEALDFVRKCDMFPLVGKINIGSSGSGVSVLANRTVTEEYVVNAFSGAGIRRAVGPKWRRKGFAGRVISKVFHPREFILQLSKYKRGSSEIQRDFVILQRFVPHDFEWRCVRIGDSFFAHKKLKINEKASGSLLKGYEDPPKSLLDFVKGITDKHGFVSQAVDIFVTEKGEYLVNEMQCIFGQSDPHQMIIGGQPGRYVYRNGEWVFEPGEFNQEESYLLRLENFVEILQNAKAVRN